MCELIPLEDGAVADDGQRWQPAPQALRKRPARGRTATTAKKAPAPKADAKPKKRAAASAAKGARKTKKAVAAE
jgi:hypothetical protein